METLKSPRRRIRAACIFIAVLGVSACTDSPLDDMLALSDRIADEANTLRFSQKSDATVALRIKNNAEWVLRREIVQRAPAWSGSAFIVYATPRGTSVTRLPDMVDVQDQTVP
jgi:hypothetical protein